MLECQTSVSLVIAELDMPIVVKRLDARYDWLPRWGQQTYRLVDVGNGCESSPSVEGAVAWVLEGGCSFFDKVSKPALNGLESVLSKCLALCSV